MPSGHGLGLVMFGLVNIPVIMTATLLDD